MNIEDKIRMYAQSKGIKPEDYDQFKADLIKGLPMLNLRTDMIELRKFIQIANLKQTKELLKQGGDTQWTKIPSESTSQTAYSPMEMFIGRKLRTY